MILQELARQDHSGEVMKPLQVSGGHQKIVDFDAERGALIFDGGFEITSETTLSLFAKKLTPKAKENRAIEKLIYYGEFKTKLWGRNFIAGVRFNEEKIHSVSLCWKDGKVFRLGYDAQDSDLLAEKKTLTNLIKNNLNAPLVASTLGVDTYKFHWGFINIQIILQSSWCGLEIVYL